ncbi:MAG: tetratricopeptide repeat protein, partial [Pirellulales bacterium]
MQSWLALPRSLLVLAAALAVFGSAATARGADDEARLTKLAERLDALENAGQFRQLEVAAQEFIGLARRMQAPVHTAVGRQSLARAYKGQQKLAEAEQAYRQGVGDLTRQRFAPQLQRVADRVAISLYHELGQLLHNRGKLRDAEATFLAGIKLGEARFGRDSMEIVPSLIDLAGLYNDREQTAQSLPLYDRAQAIIEAQPTPNLDLMTYVLHGRGVANSCQRNFDEALRLYRRELELLEQLYGPDHPYQADVLLAMAQTYQALRDWTKIEPLTTKAIALFTAAYGAQSIKVTNAQQTLAFVWMEQGRFADAELLLRESLATRETVLKEKHPFVASALGDLATLYLFQDRDAEALPLLKRALAIWEDAYGPDNAKLVNSLQILVQVQRNLGQFDAAEATARKLLKVLEAHEPESAYEGQHLLATVYRAQQRYDQALDLQQRALDANARLLEEAPSSRVEKKRALILQSIALLEYDLHRKEQSADYYRRSLEISERVGAAPGELAETLVKYAEVLVELDRQEQALPLVERAMNLIEAQRTTFSGGDAQRAQSFSKSSIIYEYAIRIQSRNQNLPAVFAAMERGQARSLLDQMAAQGIDLFDGMPPAVAERLQTRQTEIDGELARLELRLDGLDQQANLPAAKRSRQREELVADLRQRQRDYAALQSEIQNASPAYQMAVGRTSAAGDLAATQDYARRHNALVLRYFTGYGASFLMVIEPTGASSIHTLTVPQELADTLGVAAGPLTVDKVTAALANREGTGVLQLLREATTDETTRRVVPKLFALWSLLVPQAHRDTVASAEFARLIVIPDGPLAMLPFETLVVDAGAEQPRYLLDAAPPICYAPSATVLQNLEERPLPVPAKQDFAVLTVGDPDYEGAAPATTASARGPQAAGARYQSAGGQLSDLPFSGLEVQLVSQAFETQGCRVRTLVGESATEAQVRAQLAEQSIVHFACHGVIDPSFSNLFGALALTPGSANAGPQ